MRETADVKVSLTDIEPVKALLREGRQLVADQAEVIDQMTAALRAICETCAAGSPDAVMLSIESIARHALRAVDQ